MNETVGMGLWGRIFAAMNTAALYGKFLESTGVSTDTRKLEKGHLFFALRGPNFNGNTYAKNAMDAGAAYAIIDDPAFQTDDRCILVEDALEALQTLARHHRQQFSIPFLAITGSNGKTTTKELIHSVLSTAYTTYTTEGNLNNHIGVPLTLLRVKRDAQMAVIEMGANHIGEIASYCRVALPTHGLITNCGKAHLEGFGGEAGVRRGKGELYDHLRSTGGTVFLMEDYGYLQEMSTGIATRVGYGTAAGAVQGTAVPGSEALCVAFSQGLQGRVQTALVGDYNLPNALAAAAVGKHFGVADERIKGALENYLPTNSRSQRLERGTNTVVLDAYNANPSSMQEAVLNFSRWPTIDKVLVLGSMAEMGEASAEEHRRLLSLIDGFEWKDVLVVGKEFSVVPHRYHAFLTATEAADYLRRQNYKHTAFLIKGSRSAAMEKTVEAI